jgi:hypothetical protein
VPEEWADILLTIRLVESGSRYDAPPNRGNASGAYQYIASTWNNYKGYPHAYLAPAWVQDERALADLKAILWTWQGDVSMVPVIWYYPKAAIDARLMDQVPLPQAGNRLTVREYQHRWLDVLAFVTGQPSFYSPTALPPNLKYITGVPPELDAVVNARLTEAIYDPSAGDVEEVAPIAFPVLGHTVITPPIPCSYDGCEAGTSAMIFGQKLQPVLAVVNGVVTAVELSDATTGNVRVTITAKDGRRFVYEGLNDDAPDTNDGEAASWLRITSLATVGRPIYAGQIIGFMGDSDPMPGHRIVRDDEPVWPHIRLSAYDVDGTPLDTDLLVLEAQRRQACHVGLGPWSVPKDRTTDRSRKDVTVGTIVYGGWTIHRDGTVTAYGRSALILPPEDCVWAPSEPFGPGASGEKPPQYWGLPFEIETGFWVQSAVSDTATEPRTPVAN